MTVLERKIKELPPDLRREVQDFVEFLLTKTSRKKTERKRRTLRLDWAGGLAKYRNQFTSLELQKKSLDWWGR